MNTETVVTHPLISIRADADVAEAADLMVTCSMGAIGVIDESKQFIGILTERDVAALVGRRKDLTSLVVRDVVNDFPVVVDAPITSEQAAEQMKRSRVRHLIVRDGPDHRIVSMRDLFSFADFGEQEDATAGMFMSTPAVACRATAHLEEIAEFLANRDISGLPVVEGSRVIGMVSERDLAHALGGPLVRLAVRRHHRGIAGTPTRVGAVMSSPAITVSPDTPIKEVMNLMFVNEVSRLAVVNDDGLVGVITRGDILGGLSGASIKRTRSESPVFVGSGEIAITRPLPKPPTYTATRSGL